MQTKFVYEHQQLTAYSCYQLLQFIHIHKTWLEKWQKSKIDTYGKCSKLFLCLCFHGIPLIIYICYSKINNRFLVRLWDVKFVAIFVDFVNQGLVIINSFHKILYKRINNSAFFSDLVIKYRKIVQSRRIYWDTLLFTVSLIISVNYGKPIKSTVWMFYL